MASRLFGADLGEMSNGELLLQLGTLASLESNDITMYKNIVLARIGQEVWQRLTKSDQEIELLRTRTILSISDFVKKNPRISEDKLAAEIQKQIEQFKADLEPFV